MRRALSEDIGKGDLTAVLIAADASATAEVICRKQAILCGTAWFDQVFNQLDDKTVVKWLLNDGEMIEAGQLVCEIKGSTRVLLGGERTALNFLQLLSATATLTRRYVEHG